MISCEKYTNVTSISGYKSSDIWTGTCTSEVDRISLWSDHITNTHHSIEKRICWIRVEAACQNSL